MLIFVTGGSASGKSEYAEKLAGRMLEHSRRTYNSTELCIADIMAQKESKIIYLVTLKDDSPASEKKIARHCNMRKKYPHTVVECFDSEAVAELTEVAEASDMNYSVVLFDCLSGFVADVMFSPENMFSSEHAGKEISLISAIEEEIVKAVAELRMTFRNVIIVSDMVFSDGCEYDEMTEKYIALLGNVCRRTASMSDVVVEVVCGIPVQIKGDSYEILEINRNNIIDVH